MRAVRVQPVMSRVAALICAVAVAGCATATHPPRDPTVADAIRSRRAALAAAWNGADTVALDHLAMGNFVYVGPKGAPYMLADLRGQVQLFGGARGARQSSIRWLPTSVRVYAPWKIAVEQGEVVRVSRPEANAPPDSVRGVYTAQWYRGPQGWQIQAEIDSPIACTSPTAGFCGAP